eukprot:CAMPEP_0197031936 /NCGR_PEP_ID=MMETSP1384-20130603/10753_1 /TAXON_ID=29189 /ORGANISM="Ammonia sp." /LENGTH=949 /DNA_ID=CAMNT_0042461521 /DNA_START=56 /DNA_END=2905 /DNA_ORIENTATION=-
MATATDTNDDELDKLIQETQDIWKSLKHSGVEVKHSDIDIEASNTNGNNMNHQNEYNLAQEFNEESSQINLDPDNDYKLDELDKIASKMSHINIHSNQTNSPCNMPRNDDRSRTLEGLNLATPTNELSTLLMSEEPSKISQIRFSTPNNYKKHGNKSLSNFSSVPDTPFLFSPSLPTPSITNNNLEDNTTDLSMPSPSNLQQPQIQRPRTAQSLPSRAPQTSDGGSIDFSEDCWYEINALLSRAGFAVLMKQHNESFEQVPSQIIICNRFKEILKKYEAMQHETSELKLKNQEFSSQIQMSSEKISDLKQEMKQLKQENINHDNYHEDVVINIKRQLEHCKNTINKKNEEISQLKQKLQQTIEKEAVRRESVEAIFESINKRNAKKNSKKDQQQLDLMAMYEEERKKMQNEIKFLRKETRILNKKLLQHNQDSNDAHDDEKQQRQSKKKRKKSSSSSTNLSFTASSKPVSDNDEDEDDDDDAHAHQVDEDDEDDIVGLKWKPNKREISKQVESRSDIERAKELNRLEAQKLRQKLDSLGREKDELHANYVEMKEKNQSLLVELEKRPSYNEWTRLRNELNEMNKKLIETQKVASLRKYMDTRELIKRDKEIHTLNLTQIDGLPVQIMKEILQDLCRILAVKDVTVLVDNVQKIAKCVECVPILEQYISKIVRVLLASDHAPELVKVSKISPKNVFDQVIPVLKQWIVQLDKVAALSTFRFKINGLLKTRTIYKSEQQKQKEAEPLPLHEMVKQIEELVQSEEYLLSSKKCFDSAEKSLIANPDDLCHRIIRHFEHIFSVKSIEGVFPKMNQIYLELNEMRNLIKTIKSILGLPQNCATNVCFKELQKVMDENSQCSVKIHSLIAENKENTTNPSVITKWNAILMEVQSLLQCQNENEIVSQCQELIDRCKEYDAVFPRVHNLVNQLRVTLNVEYAHQILPKVKEMVAAQ